MAQSRFDRTLPYTAANLRKAGLAAHTQNAAAKTPAPSFAEGSSSEIPVPTYHRTLSVALERLLLFPNMASPAKLRHLDEQRMVFEVPKFIAPIVARKLPPDGRVVLELSLFDAPCRVTGNLTFTNDGEMSIAVDQMDASLVDVIDKLMALPREARHDYLHEMVTDRLRIRAR